MEPHDKLLKEKLMKNVDVEYIEFCIKFLGLKKRSFAKACNLSFLTLKKILLNNESVKLISLVKISRFLKVDIKVLFLNED